MIWIMVCEEILKQSKISDFSFPGTIAISFDTDENSIKTDYYSDTIEW
jgi:hypothetical protein